MQGFFDVNEHRGTIMIFNLVLKIFIFIFLGFCFGKIKIKKVNLEFFTHIIINFFIYFVFPLFIFLVIWKNESEISLVVNIFLIVTGVILGGAFFSFCLAFVFKKSFREICLPIMFMNSGYLAIPVNTLLWGEKGCEYAVIYDIAMGLTMYTLGIFLISKKRDFKQILKMPIIYAASIGVFLNYINISAPEYIQDFYKIMKTVIFPSILFLVGYQLSLVKFPTHLFKITGAGIILRMVGGGFVAYLLSSLFHLPREIMSVMIISSTMPSAVTTYILAKKYHGAIDYTASMVIFSTLVSLVIIPIIASFF